MEQTARINPKLSAYQQIWGNFDFNKTPLAPPGCKVVVHERPMERGSLACHGVVGYYIGPAMKHYRNYNSYIPETHGIRTTNTIEFFPEEVDMPTTSTTDRSSLNKLITLTIIALTNITLIETSVLVIYP
jgi:hypothetical protein